LSWGPFGTGLNTYCDHCDIACLGCGTWVILTPRDYRGCGIANTVHHLADPLQQRELGKFIGLGSRICEPPGGTDTHTHTHTLTRPKPSCRHRHFSHSTSGCKSPLSRNMAYQGTHPLLNILHTFPLPQLEMQVVM
jgi:hypothetical protein